MSILDDYIHKAAKALLRGDPVDELCREIIDVLDVQYRNPKQITALQSNNISFVYSPSDLKMILGKMKVLREQRDQEFYGSHGLKTITEHIRYLEDAIDAGLGGNDLKALYERIDRVYANYYDSYTDGLSGWSCLDDDFSDKQTELRIDKLKHFRDVELRKMKVVEAQAASLNVSAKSESTSIANSTVDLSVVVEHIDNLPDSSLAEEEKTALKGMLADLQTKNEKKREKKLQRLLSWLATKGTDVFIAAMPYIIQAVQFQM